MIKEDVTMMIFVRGGYYLISTSLDSEGEVA